jgi:hypothetical protein
VALALGAIAGPASADFTSNGSLVQQPAPSTSPAADPASRENSIDWGYVAIGSSVVALVLIGVGALATGRRRSGQGRPERATELEALDASDHTRTHNHLGGPND